jgi:hypothetical protein
MTTRSELGGSPAGSSKTVVLGRGLLSQSTSPSTGETPDKCSFTIRRHPSGTRTWFRPGERGFGTPWALAEVARVSIAYGNEHRKDAVVADVVARNLAFNELEDPDLVEGYQGPLAGFFLRMTEQLEYQLPPLHELSRSVALLAHTVPT